MAQPTPKIRLFVDAELAPEAELALPREQAHYLVSVMRRGAGDRVLAFNGRDGEWLAEITRAERRAAHLRPLEQTREQAPLPDLWLLFAPVKKARTDFIVEKAVELGCRRVVPVFTRHTATERVNLDRLRAHAVEAAEQSEGLAVPEVAEPAALDALLDRWDPARRLLFCDERGRAEPARAVVEAAGPGSWAVLIGPEGGFAEAEAERLRALPFALAASLGPRILRADTAAVAALTLWQAVLGDWR